MSFVHENVILMSLSYVSGESFVQEPYGCVLTVQLRLDSSVRFSGGQWRKVKFEGFILSCVVLC